MNFQGKNIWITGASSGIGASVAKEISRSGAHLILSGRNKTSLEAVHEACVQNGSTATIIPFDLSQEDSIDNAGQDFLKTGKTLNALYHFGGISQRSFAWETPLEVDRKIFEVNYFGTVALTKLLLPSMLENGGGHIAVTSSLVGKFGFPLRSSYSASKQALHGFFESLRAESVEKNIRVSIIIPGRIKTHISINALDKEGRSHGKMDQGQEKGMTAEKSARIICRKLKREKKEILVGGQELLMVHIRRFLPGLFYYLSSRIKPS